ncbi:hypothetical protein RJ639_011060, partial [Escallonia herrerae]
MKLPKQVTVGNEEDVSEEAVETTLRRALRFFSTLQAEGGYWPGDYGGILYLLPGMARLISSCLLIYFIYYGAIYVIGLSAIGALHSGLSQEHQREICRYLYNHQ